MGSRLKAGAGLTRREWTTGLATSAAVIGVSPTPMPGQVTSPPGTSVPTAQKNPPQGAPAAAGPASTPEQKLEKAYADIRSTSERLAKIEVPMDLEPAFAFRP